MKDITEYLNEDYRDAALYILYRNTASYIDGLKNAARKVVYVVKKEHLKDTPVKVSAMASKIVDKADYLHADTAAASTVVTMNQSFCGKNNLPVMEAIGNFGTRFIPEPSAARYIFTRPQQAYFDLIYRKEDDVNCTLQEFEGEPIEPMFYVPTLPMILVNGTDGVGVGFSSSIFPRSVSNMIKAVRASLEGKRLRNEWFKPYWNGFTGTVENVDGSWIVSGICTINGKKALIEELPIGESLDSYIKKLKKLKADGKIQRYNDYSEDDHFKFEVWLSDEESQKDEEWIKRDLGLVTSMTEVLTVFDENNAPLEPENVIQIYNMYYKIKIKYLKLRIKSEIARLTEEEKLLHETYKFIKEVIKGTIDVRLKKAEVEKVLKQKKYTYIDRLLALPIYSLTEDKAKEIEKKWKAILAELEAMKNTTPEQIWSKDLDELEAVLKKEGKL